MEDSGVSDDDDGDSTNETTNNPEKAARQAADGSWNSFDYLQHWYPVSWVCDLRPFHPTKVTLWDVDYVVAVDSNNKVITALRDQCPHKGAALSEGRMTTTDGNFLQCAYHGWSFDGTTGACHQIPQQPPPSSASRAAMSSNPRTCATAVPAAVHQGMLWLWPGGNDNPLDAAAVAPPSIPEMNDPNFRVLNRVVRDFPQVDWTLLCSNILDPDHGLFARA